MATFPCSICEASFESPKDLGTHILQKHCDQVTKSEKKEEAVIEEEKTLVMDVDPLDYQDQTQNASNDISNSDIATDQCLDDTILPVLPRNPSMEEQKQKFMMYHLSTDPPNFMRYVRKKVRRRVFM